MNKLNLSEFNKLGRIGSGASAIVYKVEEKTTKNIYAAKILNEIDEEQMIDIVREISISLKLFHPSIIKVIGYSPEDFNGDNRPTIISEYLPNGTLSQIIDLERRSLSSREWDDTKKLINIYGIASAMSFLHSNNILHRDLKPANIFMDSNLFPKVGDLGFSKISSSLTVTTSLKGTPAYMAPEIYNDNKYTKAGDVYAFGVILSVIMSGKEPYYQHKNLNAFALLIKVSNGYRPFLDPSIPEVYKELIQKCWHQEPTCRPTFDQIVSELEKNPGFITETIDQDLFEDYVLYVKENKPFFDKNKPNITNDDLIKKKSNDFCIIPSDPFELGVKYYDGFGVPVDKEKAAKYFQAASDLNNLEAKLRYGIMQVNGDGIPINIENGIKNIKDAADMEYPEALYLYATMLEYGQVIKCDKKQAVEYYIKAANKGHIDSMFAYAKILEDGIIVNKNMKKAAEYYKRGATEDHLDSIYNYGLILFNGNGVHMNKEEGLKYLKKAADKGHPDAILTYCHILYNERSVSVNKKEALIYLKKAADNGDVYSMKTYGKMMLNSEKVADKKQSVLYFELAAKKGDVESMFLYALMLEKGEIIPLDLNLAFYYFQEAASKGNPDAIFHQARMIEKGVICEANLNLASKLYKQAADLGSVDAMFWHGKALYKKDAKVEASNYFLKAANGGNVDAMFTYANMCSSGDGIDNDLVDAAKYYKMAADKGHVESMGLYGMALLHGKGVPRNEKEALKYFQMKNNY